MSDPPQRGQDRLARERNIWLATVRPDGRPHLVPLWFAWHERQLYLCIQPGSVKAANLAQNPRVSLALENGDAPLICEGVASVVPPPWPEALSVIFQQKYGWDIVVDNDYTQLVGVQPRKWLSWPAGG